MKKKIKVFLPWGSYGYANWITNNERVQNIEDADLLLLSGGEDVQASRYGEKQSSTSWGFSDAREKAEFGAIEEAVKLGIPIFGTCKGLQTICVAAGGKLIQDLHHPGRHEMVTSDGNTFKVNSLHHQAILPYRLPKTEYEVLGITPSLLSSHHWNGDNKQIEGINEEIEAAYFPKIKALGVQYHPEMMWGGKVDEHFAWLRLQVKEKLGLEITD